MSKVSFALLIMTGLTLTVYFGVAAWRLSDDEPSVQQNAWRPISADR